MNARFVLIRGGAGVAGCALLGAAMWLYTVEPKVDAEVLDPIRTSGKVGKVISNPEFDLKVEGVVVARSLKQGLGSITSRPPVTTDGVFLIVTGRAMAQKEPMTLDTAVLETPGGYTFKKASRTSVSSNLAFSDFQPLIWGRWSHIFEVPKNRLAGAHMVISESSLFIAPSAATEVDLGITKARATQMINTAAVNYDPSGRS
ncbi:hypothetical protein [Spirillospora sp. NPDC047279]|uniref:hypothetical protein n=1 Tax=Spirillospora sp. NPDC047279 TaxID=3155478 RepID=UPI0033EF18B5